MLNFCSTYKHLSGDRQIVYNRIKNFFMKAIVELNQNGLLSRPESWFDNEKVRFEHRFQPFRSLQAPPPISYDEFLDMSSTTLEKPLKTNKTNYLLESMKHFCHARSHFESLIEQSVEVSIYAEKKN